MGKRYLQRRILIFLVAAFLFILTACADGSENMEKKETAETEIQKNQLEPEHLPESKTEINSVSPEHLPESKTEINSVSSEQLPVGMETKSKWLDVDSMEVSGYDWSFLNTPYVTLASANCDGVYVKKAGYEKLNEALIDNNHLAWENICRKWNTIGDEIYESVTGQGESGIYGLPWTLENSIRMERTDSRVVSFIRCCSDYLGGAHPGYETRAYNYEAHSGKLLALDDVVKDYAEIQKRAGQKLLDNKDLEMSDVDAFLNSFSWRPSEVIWCFTQSGIEVIFPAGSVGPYVLGDVSVTLSYEEIQDVLLEEYFPVINQSCIYVEPYEDISKDFDGDGKEETLRVCYEQIINEEYHYTESVTGVVTLISDGKENTVTESVGLEYLGSYLMQTEEGKYYLYMESSWENDCHTISVFDLNRNVPVFLGTADTGGFYDMTPFDAGDFYVSKILNIMGTWNGFQKCRVGEDGFPEPMQEYYTIWRVKDAELFDCAPAEEIYSMITLRQELEAYSYREPEKPEDGTMKIISAGTELIPYRTDGETWMTFQTEEGTYIDVLYDAADPDAWERTIQGIEEHDLFDGVLYAG